MRLRSSFAAFMGRSARWAGLTFMHRAAGNIPGSIALRLDRDVLAGLTESTEVVSVVAGTNGKTTTNNLIADCLATGGRPLHCNREGNNLESGVVTSMLVKPVRVGAAAESDVPIATFECDEMYTRFVVPKARPRFFLLLNLFRDQLDRFGEIDHIQDVVAGALASSPETVFVYNGDDPLCAGIAERIGNPKVAFGISSDLGLAADRISESRFCQSCGAQLDYDYIHYGQLGSYRCPQCGWKRPDLRFEAKNVRFDAGELVFDIDGRQVRTGQTGTYMLYNVLAAYAVSMLSGLVSFEGFQRAVGAYHPENGRLQTYELGNRTLMTNLAKNPTGFNQNIGIVLAERGRVLALFVNDNDPDGRDVSWFFDIDFERWSKIEGLKAFVGGSRAHDMQVRLKYAGIDARVVSDVRDVLDATSPEDGKVYIIANYTALPEVRRQIDAIAADPGAVAALAGGVPAVSADTEGER